MNSYDRFGVEINFLTGRFVATCHNDRKAPEWPPHPARLFSALVEAWAVEDDSAEKERERIALQWLESLQPPAIATSGEVQRSVVTHFVPVNDTTIVSPSLANKLEKLVTKRDDELRESGGAETRETKQIDCKLEEEIKRATQTSSESAGKKALDTAVEMLPERRGKQPRHYPSVTLDDARVSFLWDVPIAKDVADKLDQLLQRVTRLGHSSSLVSCQLTDHQTTPMFNVCEGGNYRIRTMGRGLLASLEQKYARHEGFRVRTLPCTYTRYQKVSELTGDLATAECLIPNTKGQWLVFEFTQDSRFFPVTQTVTLARAMRKAIFHYADDPIPEEISGHLADGTPTKAPHIAFLPLPYVGSEHADGRLLGLAISLPDDMTDAARGALYQSIRNWEESEQDTAGGDLKLTLGDRGVVHLSRSRDTHTLVSLNPSIWSRKVCRWVSATPIALPKHPGRLRGGTAHANAKAWASAESAIVLACKHVGLPAPVSVQVSLNPFIAGARSIRSFPKFTQNGHDGSVIGRQLLHSTITFKSPVIGPLMLGAGRFLGLGLMRPLRDN